LFAPKYLENKLKFFPYIKEAVAFGDGRDTAAAFVNIDLPCVANWAEHRDLAFAGYMDLAARDEVYALVKDCVEKVNRDLSKESRLASSQIRRFLILPKELDADDGELTRTRKVRRRIIAERYQGLIDALYSDQTSVPFDTPVRFEDGRAGVVKTSVRLEEAKMFPAATAMRGAA
ncbi:MAG TPA: long-chain fatty acid--CoA ligase, partial [Thermoanaerobaculia bacterium]|nr:long-chain fatty acid--CoA ligase [Thermoanaerobaculia bacterium]